VRCEARVLVERLDAGLDRVVRRLPRPLDAVEEQLAAGRRVRAGQALHERRLAGAVVADEADHLARVGEVRLVQRTTAPYRC
jgi:hypothetical protein